MDGCFSWCDFTPKSEPISEKTPKAQPRRLRACNARSPHQKNPLPYFFISPPPNFFFETEKGVFWWFACQVWQRRRGFAQAAKPPRYAPSTRKFSN
jgi:hypothetical protein